MIYILDTADISAIKHCNEFYPLDGVTTNPSIISKEHAEFWSLVKEIREIIGHDKMLHIQTVQKKAEKIIEEAKLLKSKLGNNFYVKIPIGEEGLKATMELKHYGLDSCKVLAASFKTAEQVHKCAMCGCHSVTVSADLLKTLISHPMTDSAIEDFERDWENAYGNKTILDFEV